LSTQEFAYFLPPTAASVDYRIEWTGALMAAGLSFLAMLIIGVGPALLL